MQDEFMGVIKIFAGNFPPRGYMFCAGQLLSIAQNNALFSLLGTTYGGNGTTTFALPNLQGVVPVGQGNSVYGTSYNLGQVGGAPTTTILTNNMPPHVHNGVGKISVSGANSTDSVPVDGASIAVPGSIVSRAFSPTLGFTTATPSVNLVSNISTVPTGGGIPVNNMQPYLAINYIICVEGVFPNRN